MTGKLSNAEVQFLRSLMADDGPISSEEFEGIYQAKLREVAKQFGYEELLDEVIEEEEQARKLQGRRVSGRIAHFSDDSRIEPVGDSPRLFRIPAKLIPPGIQHRSSATQIGAAAEGEDAAPATWTCRFSLTTDAWVLEAWVRDAAQEVRFLPGRGIDVESACAIEMTGARTGAHKRFEIVRRSADDFGGAERLVVEGLTVGRLWLTVKALEQSEAAHRDVLVPQVLCEGSD